MLGKLAADAPVIRRTFDEASGVLGYDLWQLCQQGPVEELNSTEKTQPAMLAAEATLKAQELAGTPDITPAQMRDGMEALSIDAARLEELGMTGFGPVLEVTCANHGGPGVGLMTQWDADAKTWVKLTDFIESDKEVIRPLIEEDAAAFRAESGIEPRECPSS